MANEALRRIRQINFYKDMGVLNLRIRSVKKSIKAFSAFRGDINKDYDAKVYKILEPKFEELEMLLKRKFTMIRRFAKENQSES